LPSIETYFLLFRKEKIWPQKPQLLNINPQENSGKIFKYSQLIEFAPLKTTLIAYFLIR
jgi:hypothetical protein